VAVSGANFAVAETGTVVVVESEGNGRMCLTLPEVLVTVMGIEKLVPTWRDLEVFLQLLPRSSTAERMNPYTSLWTGVTPGDGPQAFHLVLLDNGRTDVLSDTTGRQALRCIRCSACLNVCPVTRTGGQATDPSSRADRGHLAPPRGIANGPVDKQTRRCPFASSLCGVRFESAPSGSTSRGLSPAARSPASPGEPPAADARAWRAMPPGPCVLRRLGWAERMAGRRPAVRPAGTAATDARTGPVSGWFGRGTSGPRHADRSGLVANRRWTGGR
jgi:L-lactate dehydrogenase complex protein LldF